jgi:hypothetical protein
MEEDDERDLFGGARDKGWRGNRRARAERHGCHRRSGRQAQKLVQDATASTLAAAGQAKKVLDDAGETAQQAWSQAGAVAEDVVDAGHRATRSVSRQIGDNPLIAVLVGCALGYAAGWWIHGRR